MEGETEERRWTGVCADVCVGVGGPVCTAGRWIPERFSVVRGDPRERILTHIQYAHDFINTKLKCGHQL